MRNLNLDSKFAVQEILPRPKTAVKRICLESGSPDYKFEINDKHDQKCNHWDILTTNVPVSP